MLVAFVAMSFVNASHMLDVMFEALVEMLEALDVMSLLLELI